ncbi:hypothetical protein A3F66_04480 [candidate division TM6 bacterium RIFCSPHIGHO2_12_FULL_32_22]|nr:MAG: hypothetical protein A3F66_04480 [candidate division TM6 bacterium RIFCSPHIGHO2_12_FULL_32_22]
MKFKISLLFFSLIGASNCSDRWLELPAKVDWKDAFRDAFRLRQMEMSDPKEFINFYWSDLERAVAAQDEAEVARILKTLDLGSKLFVSQLPTMGDLDSWNRYGALRESSGIENLLSRLEELSNRGNKRIGERLWLERDLLYSLNRDARKGPQAVIHDPIYSIYKLEKAIKSNMPLSEVKHLKEELRSDWLHNFPEDSIRHERHRKVLEKYKAYKARLKPASNVEMMEAGPAPDESHKRGGDEGYDPSEEGRPERRIKTS